VRKAPAIAIVAGREGRDRADHVAIGLPKAVVIEVRGVMGVPVGRVVGPTSAPENLALTEVRPENKAEVRAAIVAAVHAAVSTRTGNVANHHRR